MKTGVRIPVEQAGNEQGPANTIAGVAPMQMVAVKFFDKSGRAQEIAVIIMGGRVFVPPNAQQWLFDCKAASPWLEKAVLEHQEQRDKPVDLPSSDVAEIFDDPIAAPEDKA